MSIVIHYVPTSGIFVPRLELHFYRNHYDVDV